jgi:hypothetical protein
MTYSLISTSTPAARSSFISASTVCGVGSMMSKSRLWVALDPRRQWDRASHLRAGTLRGVDDLGRRLVEDPMIEGFEPYSDVLAVHGSSVSFRRARRYSMMDATTPAPTVLPPSRMAKRNPSSIAIGAISSISIVTLSPGITISVPCGSCTIPVTSVVRK